MERNKLVWVGVFIGSSVGGFIPSLWGAGIFSMSSVFLSALGAFAGVWFGWQFGE